MLDRFLRLILRLLLWLRYRIRVNGLERIASPDGRGVLFLANHPALIDPIILMTVLWPRFRPRVLADRVQVRRPGIRFLAHRARALEIADIARDGREVRDQVESVIDASAAALRQGDSLLLYPAGRIYRQRREDLGGNSAVEQLLHAVPGVRVVLVRTVGLWGSGFSRASGKPPEVWPVLRKGIWGLLKSALLFAPRRHVAIDVIEPDDLRRGADRVVLNRYLEDFYNRGAGGSTYVPYSFWEAGGVRWLPEPVSSSEPGVARRIPPATRATVLEHLRQLTGVREIHEGQRLAHDLGLDSLVRVEIQAWVQSEFGFAQPDVDAMETVGDVMRAAVGETVGKSSSEPKPVAHTWINAAETNPAPKMPAGDSLTGVFLSMARKFPKQVIIADQQSGVRTYRDLVTAILLLRPVFARMPGPYVGIMLPASVGACVATMAALFAGKTPVMINWTTGPRGVMHGLDLLDIRCVVTARKLVSRLESEGFAGTPGFAERLVFIDDMARKFSLPAKLVAALRARLGVVGVLEEAQAPEVGAVLFTSGSESVPKAVPLTQANLLANIRDALVVIPLQSDEALLGILPPFHSFGLTVDLLLPLMCGLRTVYHVNPNDGATLASLIEVYRATLLVGTPTFLAGIVRGAQPGQLASLRLAVTGAEKCPPHVYDALERSCPQMVVVEGYGVTECSPVVSANLPAKPRRETIGVPMPSVEHAIIDPECGKPTPCGQRGMLLVRGPSIFGGYIKHDGPSPFVSYAGKQWYRTGDLVSEDAEGILTFCGRLKRFVKIGGEMIPLAAVEAALETKWPLSEGAPGPQLAVDCTADEEHPELVLFTTLDIDREQANKALRDAGLSPLHNVRRVVKLDVVPLLGTGKTDYRALKAMLSEGKAAL